MDELARKAAAVDPAMGPGTPDAVRFGCRCSVLFNQEESFVDPSCPLHGARAESA